MITFVKSHVLDILTALLIQSLFETGLLYLNRWLGKLADKVTHVQCIFPVHMDTLYKKQLWTEVSTSKKEWV